MLTAHGIRGWVLLAIDAGLAALLKPGTAVDVEGAGTFELVSTRPHRRGLVVGFREIGDRNAAETLAGRDAFVDRGALPEPEEGEYYDFELLGASVLTPSGDVIGTISEVIATGANDVWVVQGEEGETLVPAVAGAVVEIDREGSRVVIDPVAVVAPDKPAK